MCVKGLKIVLVVTFSLIDLVNVNCVVLVTSADLAAQFQHFSLIFLTHSFSFCVALCFFRHIWNSVLDIKPTSAIIELLKHSILPHIYY